MEGKKFAASGFIDDPAGDSGVFSFNSSASCSAPLSSSSAAAQHPRIPEDRRGEAQEMERDEEDEEDDVSAEVHRSLARLDLMQTTAAHRHAHNARTSDNATPTPKLNEDGDTELHLLLIMGAGDPEIYEHLKNPLRVHVDHVNNYRQSALYLAALTNRSPQIIHRLVSLGADPSCHDSRGDTPFHIVCRNGNLELLITLMSCVPEATTCSLLYARNYHGQTCLHAAAEQRHLKLVQYLNGKMDINAQEGLCGKTILHQCIDRVVAGESCAFLKALLYIREVDVNARTFGDLRALDLSAGHQLLTAIFSVYKECDDFKRSNSYEENTTPSDIMMDYDDFEIAGKTIHT